LEVLRRRHEREFVLFMTNFFKMMVDPVQFTSGSLLRIRHHSLCFIGSCASLAINSGGDFRFPELHNRELLEPSPLWQWSAS
jgi:hypothetical protein